jgi:hypothetical protein
MGWLRGNILCILKVLGKEFTGILLLIPTYRAILHLHMAYLIFSGLRMHSMLISGCNKCITSGTKHPDSNHSRRKSSNRRIRRILQRRTESNIHKSNTRRIRRMVWWKTEMLRDTTALEFEYHVVVASHKTSSSRQPTSN